MDLRLPSFENCSRDHNLEAFMRKGRVYLDYRNNQWIFVSQASRIVYIPGFSEAIRKLIETNSRAGENSKKSIEFTNHRIKNGETKHAKKHVVFMEDMSFLTAYIYMSPNPETRIQHKQHSIDQEDTDLHLWNHVNDVEGRRNLSLIAAAMAGKHTAQAPKVIQSLTIWQQRAREC
ncbi:hypothetical protein NC651_031007 [Populus alba x Populus x berolinensis]|nr:hypothetical protein NC651_031007 [Populus alba x Populus x berolinensis]